MSRFALVKRTVLTARQQNCYFWRFFVTARVVCGRRFLFLCFSLGSLGAGLSMRIAGGRLKGHEFRFLLFPDALDTHKAFKNKTLAPRGNGPAPRTVRWEDVTNRCACYPPKARGRIRNSQHSSPCETVRPPLWRGATSHCNVAQGMTAC